MIQLAILIVVLPGRSVFSRRDYKKLALDRVNFKAHKSKVIGHIVNKHISVCCNVSYITRPLTPEEVLGFKLIANYNNNIYDWSWGPDCIVLTSTEAKYEELLKKWQDLDAAIQRKDDKTGFDYDALASELAVLSNLASGKGETIKTLNSKITKCGKRVKRELEKRNKEIYRAKNKLIRHLENEFKVEFVLDFE